MLKKISRTAALGLLVAAAGLTLLQARPALTAANVKATDGATLKKAVAAQKGKVTVVNLWATWCGPCVQEFPDLVKLHNKYKAKGLSFISVTIDDPEAKAQVVSFINKQNASFPVYMRRTGEVEPFIFPLDRNWTGAVPTTYIFNKQGKLAVKPMLGARSFAQLEAAIKPLL